MKIVLRIPKTAPLDLRLPRVTDGETHDTDRTCSSEGCTVPAREIEGHYFVESRRVRVWACSKHWSKEPLREVAPPRSIAVMLKNERKRREVQERIMRNTPVALSESVRAFAPAGSGATPKFNSADSFRWGENPGDVETRIHALSPREAMIVRMRSREQS